MEGRQHSAGLGVAIVLIALGVLFMLLMLLFDDRSFIVLLVVLGVTLALVVALMVKNALFRTR
jgi:hypothetical protein